MAFSMSKSIVDFKWELETYFGDKQNFLDAIKTYSLKNVRILKFIKNNEEERG